MFDHDEFSVGDGTGEWAGEAELVDELLSLVSEAELDQFLGKLARRTVKASSAFLRSATGKAVKRAMRNLARTTLPAVGAAVGTIVAPGVGTAVGRMVGTAAGGWLEVDEAEELTDTEAEYEAARRFVRVARQVFRTAARAPRSTPPHVLVRTATAHALRRHAPPLFRQRRAARRRRRRPTRPAVVGGYTPVLVPVPDTDAAPGDAPPGDAGDEPSQEF